MKKGDVMQCELLLKGKPTGQFRKVRVNEVRLDHVTQKPESVRVTTLTQPRTLWVSPQYLHEVSG